MKNTEFRAIRQKMGKKQAELAAMLGFSIQQISNYETGRNAIPRSIELALHQLEYGSLTTAPSPTLGRLTPEDASLLDQFTKSLRQNLPEQIILMIVFGSKVRGDFTKESDLDLLIVVAKRDQHIRHKIYDILFSIDPDYSAKISPVIYSLQEYQENERMGTPFIQNLKWEGRLL